MVIFLSITGASIKKLRTASNLTQKKLAELAGVSQAHIAKIEQGKVDPRLSTVNKILAILTEGKKIKCKDVMTDGVLFANPNSNVLEVSEIMVHNGISQMPVLNGNRVIGTITEENIIRNLGKNIAQEKIKNVMAPPLPTASEETPIDIVRSLLEKHQGVLVTRDKEIVGVITRSDLLKTIC